MCRPHGQAPVAGAEGHGDVVGLVRTTLLHDSSGKILLPAAGTTNGNIAAVWPPLFRTFNTMKILAASMGWW